MRECLLNRSLGMILYTFCYVVHDIFVITVFAYLDAGICIYYNNILLYVI